MIASIRGVCTLIKEDWVLVETYGVGYRIFFAKPESLKLNQEVFFYTYHNIREDDQSLYGFLSLENYELFERLLSVKGIGPRIANSMFVNAKALDIITAIESSNVDFLKKMPGIGAKTASQIILDLKGKLVNEHTDNSKASLAFQETLEALKGLGYKSSELSFLNQALANHLDESSDKLIKRALILLNQRKGN